MKIDDDGMELSWSRFNHFFLIDSDGIVLKLDLNVKVRKSSFNLLTLQLRVKHWFISISHSVIPCISLLTLACNTTCNTLADMHFSVE